MRKLTYLITTLTLVIVFIIIAFFSFMLGRYSDSKGSTITKLCTYQFVQPNSANHLAIQANIRAKQILLSKKIDKLLANNEPISEEKLSQILATGSLLGIASTLNNIENQPKLKYVCENLNNTQDNTEKE